MKSSHESILEQIRQIQQMERGKLCPMRGGRYYNHQTWQNGRNVVRYVPAERVSSLRQAIAGYQRYLRLTQAYAEQIIQETRTQQIKTIPEKSRRNR